MVAAASALHLGGAGEACTICNTTVYAAERVSTDGRVYHAGCFRCHTCNKKLALGTYAQIEGTLFCKPHFDAQFHATGRYEVGNMERQYQQHYGQRKSVTTTKTTGGGGGGGGDGGMRVLRGMENTMRDAGGHAAMVDKLRAIDGGGDDAVATYLDYLIEQVAEQEQRTVDLRAALEDLREHVTTGNDGGRAGE